jgi:small subunit ribosomal protein S20
MANIKSQIRRNRQNEARRGRNKSVRSYLKTKTKRFTDALDEGDTQSAREALEVASRELDKAAAKGVIHKNKAANKKARLAKRLSALP